MSKALATKNVAAVLVALSLALGLSFAFVQPAKADTVSDLQAQVQALLAQISALQGSSSSTTTMSAGCQTFTQNLSMGKSGGEVMWVQQFLNGHGFTVAASGAGSPGNETSYFGAATKAAVIKFQNAYASSILTPVGLTVGNGNWFSSTRAEANALCAGSTSTGTTGTGGTTTTGAGITITSAAQPANSLAPQLANRVPFTTFTITNNSGAAVTINGIDVQRTGFAADAAFAGVELIDQNGLQIGTSRTFNSNHQAEIGTPWTLAAGASMTYTVAGNMAANETAYSGQVASIEVTGVDTTVPVSGSLPITGASQTINSTLAIGTASAQRSSFDPLSARSEPLGTTALVFSGIRVTAGSAENEKLYSITWNQTGSVGSTDLANLVTVVNGTSYPVTVDSTGKYYTATFPGGILINEGASVDAYIQGDIVGNDASGRTIEFDIYRQSDVYLVGQTYGYGVTPTASSYIAASVQTTAPWSSGFIGATATGSSQPFYQGALVSVTAGTLSTVGNAGSVGSQNIAVNVPNQPLGGFTTDFTGEPVQVQSLVFTVATSSASGIVAPGNDVLTNVTIVDQNGNTVAGPVNQVGTTLTFNSSVTFPVGGMTYTLKGTVGYNAVQGETYQLSTNPGTQWTGAQGETSGATVALPTTAITMSTMTVQAGSLIVSAASTPASTNVAPGANNFVIANINLDASQSGEDIRLSSLPIAVVATSSSDSTNLKSYLSNCQLWNGTTALNTQSVGSSQWSATTALVGVSGGFGITAPFTFQNSLTIPKGTVVTLSLECNISSSIYSGEQFSAGVNAGVDTSTTLSPTGVESGNTITATVQNSVSGTMTVGSASLAATLPTALSFAQVAGGTTGVSVGTFTLQPTSDSVNLQNIGLSLNSNYASSSDVMRAYIYNGATQVGAVNFTGSPSGHYYFATSSISTLNLPQNIPTTLTIKADIAAIGAGQAGTDGHEVMINLADAQGTGASSGATVHSGPLSASQTGVDIYRTYPTVAAAGSSSGTLLAGTQTLAEFTVSANSTGALGIYQLGINVATSTASAVSGTTTVSGLNLYAYTDSGFSIPAPGTASGLVGSSTALMNSGTNKIQILAGSNPLEIPAGTTYYFKATGTVTETAGSGTFSGTVQTYLAGDSTNLAPNMSTAGNLTGTYSLVWSPNSTTTQPVTAVDWTNGYGVSGLPSTGLPVVTLH